MNSRCSVCNHPLIDDINLAVLSGDYSLNQLSRKFGPSRDAFHRHKRHLERKMNRTQWRLENHRKQVALLKLDAFLGHVEKRVEAAAAAEDTDRVYKGAQIGSRLIHLINKMDLPLEPETAYRLLAAPGPVSHDRILPAGPQAIANLHRALVDQACAPCPPPAEDELDDTGANQSDDQPALEKELRLLLADLESKNRHPQPPKAERPEGKKLRRQKHLRDGETASPNPSSLTPLPCPLPSGAPPAISETGPAPAVNVGRESAAPPAVQRTAAPPETPTDHCLADHRPLTPDRCLAAPEPQPERDKSATEAPQERRQLRKVVQNLRHIFKSKKSSKSFTGSRESDDPHAPQATSLPPETRNPKPKPPPNTPCFLDRTADELFEISHGYKRDNPPKKIPNRRRDEDFPSTTIFGDVKTVLKHMLG